MALSILDGNQTATTLSTILTGGAHIPAHTVVSLGSQAITDMRSAVSGSVVSISNFPSTQTIAGTVTANAFGVDIINSVAQPIPLSDSGEAVVVDVRGGFGQANVPISGTVTANLVGKDNAEASRNILTDAGGRLVVIQSGSSTCIDDEGNIFGVDKNFPIQGTVTANLSSVPTHGVTIANSSVTVNGTFYQATQPVSLASLPSLAAGTAQIGSVTASVSALPSGALTTRFGSVTTANTAQITSAVTNTSRKYLLAQNISAGTVTIGIGFSPTTTQGIQLAAGGGLTFDAFCPTGAVYWLGATTGATWTILEG